jgi:RNA polymerase sigma-70 factor (ECF subfamily)
MAQRLARLEESEGEAAAALDGEHDEFVARQLMALVQPEFAPEAWRSFRLLVLDERPASAVAAELGLTVNAVLFAKSRVLRRLREEGRGLID